MKKFLAVLYLAFCDTSSYSVFFVVFLVGVLLVVAGFFSGAWPVAIIGACLSVIFLILTIKNFKKAWAKALKEVSLVENKK
jgi:hypothetical protein